MNGAPPSLIALDPGRNAAAFSSDLQHLDSLSCRAHHTVHVFYVKAGQSMPFEILNNVVSLLTQQLKVQNIVSTLYLYCILLGFRSMFRRLMRCLMSFCCLLAGQLTSTRTLVGQETCIRVGESTLRVTRTTRVKSYHQSPQVYLASI